MPSVGLLANKDYAIVFVVSSNVVQTFDSMQHSFSAQIAEHKRHLGDTVVEFTGTGARKITFTMKLSAALGVKPEKVISELTAATEAGSTLNLILGEKRFGEYKWLITGFSATAKQYYGNGEMSGADISVTLISYAKN